MIIDLAGIRDGTGPARLDMVDMVDMVEGRDKQASKAWLTEHPQAWRDRVEVVAMDGFTRLETATTEEPPEAVAVMDPFHVVRLARDALDQCRRRLQQDTCGHRGRTGDPLNASRRTLHTGADLLTDKQQTKLQALFTTDEHAAVEVAWSVCQQMIAAFRHPDRKTGRTWLNQLIDTLRRGVPNALSELITLSPDRVPPSRRAADVLAYSNRPGTSNDPTEAVNGRLKHPRGSAVSFRNLTDHIARSDTR